MAMRTALLLVLLSQVAATTFLTPNQKVVAPAKKVALLAVADPADDELARINTEHMLEGGDDDEKEEKQEDNADTEVERINIAHLLSDGDDSEVDDSKSDDDDESESQEEETAKPDYADEAADLAA